MKDMPKGLNIWWWINISLLLIILLVWIYKEINSYGLGILRFLFLLVGISSVTWEFIYRRNKRKSE
ncbi:hypothetical protein DP73_00640 [Desulfosporosinus sp. HMP52]|nr:hypothetical protein DP73_00640 [Desulfosporosinus sp. HMP52]